MLTDQMNEASQDEDNVALSNTKETEKKQRKRKKDCEEKNKKKRKKDCEEKHETKEMELAWKPEDCAKPLGEVSKVTGKGKKKKSHFKTFTFRGNQYALEDSVQLVPDDPNSKPYCAIIKDIYIPNKEKYVKLAVHWFYRPEDVDKKHVGKWESKDSRNLFYSFHRDEVFAESVKHKCVVNFVPENKQIPNRREHPCFIVQNVYDFVKKKLRKFTDKNFDVHQKNEIDRLVAKTSLCLGDLPDIEKDQVTKTSKGKRTVQRKSPKTSTVYKSILEDFDLLTGDSDRDKRLGELLEAVKHECRTSKKKGARDDDSYWPDDVVPVVRALEHVFYDSMAEDMSKYHHKLEILVDELKTSRLLARRLLDGELKPEQVVKMTRYELTRGFTFDDITADLEEPIMRNDAPSTSNNVGQNED
ncbi:unnamed protein product [Arabidopsis thaliana]|uniref:BAH domain-containing protein n=1 Tax=Arabidopsis thaliana TaxID=3702 RepID=A0A178VZM0_ARATH|nr:hypothetical protein AXX17_AT2G20850 [Arabidopsis thaliana]VYS53436.1 unnamed protein product [Arabidopsis thaliana]